MSSKTDTADFEEFDTADAVETDDGDDWIDLEAGEVVAGELTGFRPNASHNGVIEIDGRPMTLNRTLRRELISVLIENIEVAVRCLEEEESFENSDGETVTYHPREIGVREADD